MLLDSYFRSKGKDKLKKYWELVIRKNCWDGNPVKKKINKNKRKHLPPMCGSGWLSCHKIWLGAGMILVLQPRRATTSLLTLVGGSSRTAGFTGVLSSVVPTICWLWLPFGPISKPPVLNLYPRVFRLDRLRGKECSRRFTAAISNRKPDRSCSSVGLL